MQRLIEEEDPLRDTILGKCTFGETVLFYKNISSYFEQFNFKGTNITTPEFFLLSCLNKLGETTYYSLSRQLPYSSKYILNLIKNLEKNNLIEREKTGNKKLIKITSQGREMFKEIDKERIKLFQKINDNGVSWKDMVTFYSVMERMNEIFQEEI